MKQGEGDAGHEDDDRREDHAGQAQAHAEALSLLERREQRGLVEPGIHARRAAARRLRRPPRPRRPRSPCSAMKSASAPSRRARVRVAGRSSAARWASSASASSSIPLGGGTLLTATTGVPRSPSERSAALRSRRALQRHLAEVGLGHDQHVGDLHDPGLDELQRVAGAGLDDDGDGVGRLRHLGLGLADADGLDHHDVEGGRQRLRGGAGGGGEAAEPLPGGGRADEQPAVARVGVDPRAVAEQRAAGALGGGVDGEHGDGAVTRAPRARRARSAASTCRRPGGPVTPTTWAGASPPSRWGDTSASSAAISSRLAGERFSTRLSAAGAAVRSRSRSRAPSSAPVTARGLTIRAAASPHGGACRSRSRRAGAGPAGGERGAARRVLPSEPRSSRRAPRWYRTRPLGERDAARGDAASRAADRHGGGPSVQPSR